MKNITLNKMRSKLFDFFLSSHEKNNSSSQAQKQNQTVKTAVIGVGYFGRFHAQKYASSKFSELVALIDTSPEEIPRKIRNS